MKKITYDPKLILLEWEMGKSCFAGKFIACGKHVLAAIAYKVGKVLRAPRVQHNDCRRDLGDLNKIKEELEKVVAAHDAVKD